MCRNTCAFFLLRRVFYSACVHVRAYIIERSFINSPGHGTFSEPERHRPVGTVPGSRGGSLQQRVGDRLPQPMVHRGRPGGMSHARVRLRIEGRHQRRLRARYGTDMANQRHLCWQRGLHRQLLIRRVGQHGLHPRFGRGCCVFGR